MIGTDGDKYPEIRSEPGDLGARSLKMFQSNRRYERRRLIQEIEGIGPEQVQWDAPED